MNSQPRVRTRRPAVRGPCACPGPEAVGASPAGWRRAFGGGCHGLSPYSRSMICLPMITVTAPAESTKIAGEAMPRPGCATRAREEVDQRDLDAVDGVEEHRQHEAELEHVDDWVLVGGGDPVVGLGSPADDRGVDDVGEQEQDDRDAGDAVEEPRPLALVTLVDGPEVVLLLRLRVRIATVDLRD